MALWGMRARFLFLLWCVTTSLVASDIRVGYDVSEPHQFPGPDGTIIGTDADLLREVLAKVDVTPIFLERPWVRTLDGVAKGDLEVAIGAKFTRERAQFAHYSAPYKRIDHWLWVRSGEFGQVASLTGFLEQGRRLGLVRGWGYPPAIATVIASRSDSDPQLVFVNKPESLPQLLGLGRVDGIIFSPDAIGRLGPEAPAMEVRARYAEPLHFLFSRATVDVAFVQRFNTAFYELLAAGRVEAIAARYSARP